MYPRCLMNDDLKFKSQVMSVYDCYVDMLRCKVIINDLMPVSVQYDGGKIHHLDFNV